MLYEVITHDVQRHRDEVAGAAGQHEAMPDRVRERDAFVHVEIGAGRVGNTAGQQPGDGA